LRPIFCTSAPANSLKSNSHAKLLSARATPIDTESTQPPARFSHCGDFKLKDRDVRGSVVPADLPVNLDMMADVSEPAAEAYLDALALCETESIVTFWVHDLLGIRPAIDRSGRSPTLVVAMRVEDHFSQGQALVGTAARERRQAP
jgi:hypothetical protein